MPCAGIPSPGFCADLPQRHPTRDKGRTLLDLRRLLWLEAETVGAQPLL